MEKKNFSLYSAAGARLAGIVQCSSLTSLSCVATAWPRRPLGVLHALQRCVLKCDPDIQSQMFENVVL